MTTCYELDAKISDIFLSAIMCICKQVVCIFRGSDHRAEMWGPRFGAGTLPTTYFAIYITLW